MRGGRFRTWFIVMTICLGCAATASAGFRFRFCRARRPVPCCYTQPRPACPPKTFVLVDSHLLVGSYFMVFTQDVTGTSHILGDVNTIQEAMDLMQRHWAAGNNSVYFQRVMPPKKT